MYGVHGTCRTWAKQILEKGFSPSTIGHSGPGIYFWRYFDNNTYASYLAYRWWKYSENKGTYNKQPGVKDTKCDLIYAKFNVDEDNILDLSHGKLKEGIRDMINQELKKIKQLDNVNISKEKQKKEEQEKEQIISTLYQIYVDTLEEIRGTDIKIIVADLVIPKGAGGKVGRYFGNAAEAVVVLDNKCIEILNHQEVDNYEY